MKRVVKSRLALAGETIRSLALSDVRGGFPMDTIASMCGHCGTSYTTCGPSVIRSRMESDC